MNTLKVTEVHRLIHDFHFFPQQLFNCWNKKWKLNNIGQSKSLIQHPETICWLMTWMTVNFQDGCQLFRMIVNFSGWFQTFQDGWGGYNAFAVYCLRSSGWSYLRKNKEHSIVFSWVLPHFFPTSRLYLKTNKEHSIVFSLEYYWHRIRPIPMMTNPIHGPLSYRVQKPLNELNIFSWVWFDSDQVSWILILAFAVCLLVARRSSHGRVTTTGKKIARHTITLLTTSERKEHI